MGFVDFVKDPLTLITLWLEGLLLGWGLPAGWTQILMFVMGAFVLGAGSMFFTIVLIWVERKVAGRFQDRFGPNRIGPYGIFQPFADMGKIFLKEFITPYGVDPVTFYLGPILAVAGVVALYAVIPLAMTVVGVNLNVGVLYIIGIGGIGEFGIIFAGWGSNNKYALLASFRAIAQLISYEVPMVIILLIPVMMAGSMGLNDIVIAQEKVWFIFLSPLAALLFFISSMAENGRAPFDLLEADSELVAGFNVEYSGLKFGMFYVADFLHAFTLALIFAVLFLGGWRGPFAEQIPILGVIYILLKAGVVYFINMWVRCSLPRFRIDQMLDLNWKVMTPFSIGLIIFTSILDKLIPAGSTLVRVAALMVMNVCLWIITMKVVESRWNRRPRPKVVATPRAVARWDNPPPQTNSGAPL
jgi:NADH-quinone oxidoreductase subunit H